MLRRFAVASALLLLGYLPLARAENTPVVFAVDDEFVGPFTSWVDVKHDFGAVGDGKADDTVALQKALDALRSPNRAFHVLYLPAGEYRITGTLRLRREQQDESQNLMILGADALLKATKVDGVYSADPKEDPSATRYDKLSYMDALKGRLNVMDSTAFSLCMDNRIPIVVFNLFEYGNIKRAILGEPIGTLVAE